MKPSLFNQKRFTFKDAQSILVFALLGLVLVAGLVTFNWWLAGQYGAGAELEGEEE
jgi:hypothetical protein